MRKQKKAENRKRALETVDKVNVYYSNQKAIELKSDKGKNEKPI